MVVVDDDDGDSIPVPPAAANAPPVAGVTVAFPVPGPVPHPDGLMCCSEES